MHLRAIFETPVCATTSLFITLIDDFLVKAMKFKSNRKLMSSNHPFSVTLIRSYRQPHNLKNIHVKSTFLYNITRTGNKMCEKPYAMCAALSLQILESIFLEQAMFSI